MIKNFYFQPTAGLIFNGAFMLKLNSGMTWSASPSLFFLGIQANAMKQNKKKKEERKKRGKEEERTWKRKRRVEDMIEKEKMKGINIGKDKN